MRQERRPARPRRRTTLTVLATVALLPLAGCVSAAPEAGPGGEDPTPSTPVALAAQRVLQVSSPHESTGMTLLEGPTFDEEGRLHLVDVTAPEGAPKVMRIDLDTEEITPLVTEGDSAFTSAQWSPRDGRLYLTDYASGTIISVTAEGEDARTVFAGDVDGRTMHPDDLAFDESGNMYISDSSPTTYPDAAPSGRVVRIDAATAEASVLADGQPNPNGISLDPDGGALWVSQLDANQIDRLALDADGTAIAAGHTAVHIDGGPAQTDSNAIDAAGNIYQAFHGIPQIRVFAPDGTHIATVAVPAEHEGLESATNLAIRPGTSEAYMTVSGPAGGFVYRFDALAEGTRSSNGG